jgi:hypothetical protein
MNKFIQFSLICFLASGIFANQFYVSPLGSVSGDGSFSNPWDLQTALNQPGSVLPGDTLWLRGGTYAGNFISNLSGSNANYIYVLQYPEERAKIEDNRQYASGATLQVNGAWTIYKGFEITNANANRTSTNSSSFRPMGLQVVAPNSKFINLIIHDVGHGFGFWKEAVNSEIYGCIIYNCGSANKPGQYSTHGHGIYSQNNTGVKTIRHNLIFNQFGFGLHIYPNPGNVNGYLIDGNTLFNNGILTHDTVRYNNILVNPYPPYTCNDVVIQNNLTYDSKLTYTYTALIESDLYLGASNVNSKNLQVQNNYLMGKGRAGLAILSWDSVKFQNNTTYYSGNGSAAIALPAGVLYSAHSWNNNTYYGGSSVSQYSYQYGPLVDFSGWKAITGFDASSSFLASAPSSSNVVVQANQYENGRANVLVYNWGLQSTVSIDLSGVGLVDGQSFTIVDAQDFFGSPIFSGVYNSASPTAAVNLTGLAPVAPHGMTALASTSPEFASLVVLPQGIPTTTHFSNSFNIITIGPNPADEYVELMCANTKENYLRVELVDLLGEVNGTWQINTNSSFRISTSQYNAGIYLLKVSDGENFFVKKLILK